MADDKFSDSRDESDESTPMDPTDSPLADRESPGETGEMPAELSDRDEIVDPQDDGYVDDPETVDINEAKLDRATDEVADAARTDAVTDDALTADPAKEASNAGTGAQRRSRAGRPVRKDRLAEATEGELVSQPQRSGAGRTRTTAPVRKDTTTQAEAEGGSKRTTPAKFVAESIAELRKVVWPTGTQVQQYFVVVLVFVLFIMTFVSLLDLGFGWVILRIFG